MLYFLHIYLRFRSLDLVKSFRTKNEPLEMYCFRWIGNISWKDKVSNENVLKKINTKRSLLKDIQKKTSVLRSHQTQRKSSHNYIGRKMEGKRPRGCPRISWFCDVKEWTSLPAADCTRMAASRSLWSVTTSRHPKRR